MGTEKETFHVLELRAREIVERMKLLKEENAKIKMQNGELLSRQEKIRVKTRKLLDRLSN